MRASGPGRVKRSLIIADVLYMWPHIVAARLSVECYYQETTAFPPFYAVFWDEKINRVIGEGGGARHRVKQETPTPRYAKIGIKN